MSERTEEIDTSVFGERTRTEAEQIIERYPESRSALLPMLHLVQSEQGHVSGSGIHFCAELLGLSVAEVTAVASFYTLYKRAPGGQHLVSVCTNTMCAVMGGDAIYRALGEHLGVGHEGTAGEPGTEGSITLEHAECLAACDFAPMLQVNYEYYDNQSPEQARELVKALQRGEKPAPSRGPELSDFRGAERQLAGFFDDLDSTVTGPSSATETLRGAQLADERGWTAPSMPDDAELPPVPEKK